MEIIRERNTPRQPDRAHAQTGLRSLHDRIAGDLKRGRRGG